MVQGPVGNQSSLGLLVQLFTQFPVWADARAEFVAACAPGRAPEFPLCLAVICHCVFQGACRFLQQSHLDLLPTDQLCHLHDDS